MLPSLQPPLSPSPGGFSRPQAGNGMLCRWLPGRPRLAGWLPSGNTERANPPSEPSRASSRLVQTPERKQAWGNCQENGSALGEIFPTGLARETVYVSGVGWQEGLKGGQEQVGRSLPSPYPWVLASSGSSCWGIIAPTS